MAVAVKMPKQGQSVEHCILTQWLVKVGDKVEKGDILFSYETDKAAFDLEAPEAGTLLVRYFEEGQEVPVLENVAVIGEKGESFDAFLPDKEGIKTGTSDSTTEKVTVDEPVSQQLSEPDEGATRETSSDEGISISPRARKLAREKRIHFQSIRGSGPGGRIIERDIQEEIRKGKRMTPLAEQKMKDGGLSVPAEGRAPYAKISAGELQPTGEIPGGEYQDVPLGQVRKIIAAAMHRSLQQSAQLTHHMGANATKILRFREHVKLMLTRGYFYNITLNDMICYAVIRALGKYPQANAHFLGDRIRTFRQVHLGVAVDTDRGLMVPVLRNAGIYSLEELSVKLRELAEMAKTGKISPDLIAPEAGSFTISNLGNYGVEIFTPVINLPQVAILGVNTILQRPVSLADGNLGFQPFLGLSLTYDHRAVDGGPATRFLAEIRDQVERIELPNLS